MTAPHSIEAEKGVLSCCLLHNPCIDLVIERFGRETEAFYGSGRAIIWTRMCDVFSRGEPVDLITLTRSLRDRGDLDRVGGASELADILSFAPAPAHLDHYLAALNDKLLMRRALQEAYQTIKEVEENPADVAQWISSVESRHMDLAGHAREDDSFQAAINELADNLVEAEQGRDRAVPFGIPQLDSLLGGGVRPKQLCIVAARPSQGKTAVGLQQLTNLCSHGTAAGFFSLEMPRADLVAREVCRQTGVTYAELASGFRLIRQAERAAVQKRVNECFRAINRWPMRLDDRAGLHIDQIRAKARIWKRRHKIQLIVIDYLQLVRGKGDKREQEISYVSRESKAMAKELDIPVVLLAQLNREGVGEPEVYHLRESGAIEQDADIIILIADALGDEEDGKIPRRFKLGKNRNGVTSKHGVPVWFDGRRFTFEQRNVEVPDPVQKPRTYHRD